MRFLSLAYVLVLVNAQTKAETVASNLGSADNGFIQVANDVWWGVEFTTDSRSYLLNSVTLSVEAHNNNGTFSVNIYSAGAETPGSLLPSGHLQGVNPGSVGLYTYNASAAIQLTACEMRFRSN